jgi:AraC-like DNA-binding protein
LDEADRQRSSELPDGVQYDKERMLLAFIRAGDRVGAKRILNELLAAIYMSVPRPIILQARIIELVSSLTRAAIEDNPLLESLVLQNLQWIEKMVHADGFESLSTILMQALDEFIDAVHLHGVNRTNTHVHKALTFIWEHYDEPLSLDEVARNTGISMYRLAHLFRIHTGKTVVETIRQVRLQRAELLLRNTSMTCAEVGYTVGFSDQSYFISHFKKHAGVTPGKYRRVRAVPTRRD